MLPSVLRLSNCEFREPLSSPTVRVLFRRWIAGEFAARLPHYASVSGNVRRAIKSARTKTATSCSGGVFGKPNFARRAPSCIYYQPRACVCTCRMRRKNPLGGTKKFSDPSRVRWVDARDQLLLSPPPPPPYCLLFEKIWRVFLHATDVKKAPDAMMILM